MATDNLAKQLSCSWFIPGGTADPTAEQIFQEIDAQGQSFFDASGDDDAYTGLISFPGDSPNITQVGGTTLQTGSGGSYSSETVWNWDVEYYPNDDGRGSGGGYSTQYEPPSYQQGVDLTAYRSTPDVALTADHCLVYADGQNLTDRGGTSFAAPLWAGFTALVNQQIVEDYGAGSVGFINPAVYAIGANPSRYSNDFHDVETGNNEWSGSPNQFTATAGYDLCTGWGSPNGQSLVNDLANTPVWTGNVQVN